MTVKKKLRWCFKPKAGASSLSHRYACAPVLHVHTQNICTYSTFSFASLLDEHLETSKIKDKTKCVIRIIWKQVCRAQTPEGTLLLFPHSNYTLTRTPIILFTHRRTSCTHSPVLSHHSSHTSPTRRSCISVNDRTPVLPSTATQVWVHSTHT